MPLACQAAATATRRGLGAAGEIGTERDDLDVIGRTTRRAGKSVAGFEAGYRPLQAVGEVYSSSRRSRRPPVLANVGHVLKMPCPSSTHWQGSRARAEGRENHRGATPGRRSSDRRWCYRAGRAGGGATRCRRCRPRVCPAVPLVPPCRSCPPFPSSRPRRRVPAAEELPPHGRRPTSDRWHRIGRRRRSVRCEIPFHVAHTSE